MSKITDAVTSGQAKMLDAVANFCAGRLNLDEMDALAKEMTIVTADVLTKVEKLVDDMKTTMAGDRALAFDTATRGAVREVQDIRAAEQECAPFLAGTQGAFDSAPAVYRQAISNMGRGESTRGVAPEAMQAIFRAVRDRMPAPGAAIGTPTNAQRNLAAAGAGSFDSRFPTATKIVRS